MIQAVIFDMDGLMIDSERVTFEGYVKYCKELKKDFTEDIYKRCLGKPVPGIHQVFYDEYGDDFPIPEIMKKVHTYMADRFEKEGVPLKKGLLPLLQYLKEHQIKTIVATSSDRVRVDSILKRANMIQYFDDSICGDEVTNGKPDPEVFLRSLEKLHVDAKDAIVLEDSEAGIQAAFRANIKVICVPDMKYPEPEYEKLAYKIVDDLSKVIEIIK